MLRTRPASFPAYIHIIDFEFELPYYYEMIKSKLLKTRTFYSGIVGLYCQPDRE